MRFHVDVVMLMDEEQDNYFEACCRIREVSRIELARMVLYKVFREQLVLAVLDDDSKPPELTQGQRKYRQRKTKKIMAAGCS
jgi:hypothetical protein